MKIAVATENGECVSADFYRSPYFVVLDVEAGRIINRSIRRNTAAGFFRRRQGSGGRGTHRDGADCPDACLSIEDTIKDCRAVISHRLGRNACEGLKAHGIDLIATEETQVERAVLKYLDGTRIDSLDGPASLRPYLPDRVKGT